MGHIKRDNSIYSKFLEGQFDREFELDGFIMTFEELGFIILGSMLSGNFR